MNNNILKIFLAFLLGFTIFHILKYNIEDFSAGAQALTAVEELSKLEQSMEDAARRREMEEKRTEILKKQEDISKEKIKKKEEDKLLKALDKEREKIKENHDNKKKEIETIEKEIEENARLLNKLIEASEKD